MEQLNRDFWRRMRRLARAGGMLLLVALMLTGGPGAQAQGNRSFLPVPVGHWSYQAVRDLAGEGYAIGFAARTFDGSRVLTRFDFATAVSHLLDDFPQKIGQPTAASSLSSSALKNYQAQINVLRRLLTEYEAEARQLGVDAAKSRTMLAAVEGRLRRLVARADSRRRRYGLGAALRPQPLSLGLGLESELPSARVDSRVSLPGNVGAGLSAARQIGATSQGLRLPFGPAGDSAGFAAQLRRPIGKYLLTAFYTRRVGDARSDPLGLQFLGANPQIGVGGLVTRSFGDRLTVGFGGGSYRRLYGREDGGLLALGGGLRYALPQDLSLDIGFERLFLSGADRREARIYNLGVGREFGPNMRLQFLYQYFNLYDRASGGGGSVQDGSAAITRFTVRF